MTNFVKHNWSIFVVLLLSFWAINPVFTPGFFPMHDDTQVARVFEMGKMLKDGMFPVRWVQDLGYGYGYPIFNFYAPLAYYVGGFFTLLGFDALTATKIMMIIGILLSGLFMYLLAKEFWGELGGVVSGLFYVYVPYHALDIYVRGDVAEFWAYAFIPLMFWGFYKAFSISHTAHRHSGDSERSVEDSRISTSVRDSGQARMTSSVWKWVVIGSLGYAGVILSHNLTAMMVTPFLVIAILLYCYIAYRGKKLFTIYYLLFTILLGLALSAFYWLPALLEMKYTNVLSQIGGGADFSDHFVCIGQLWESNWGFGGSALGCISDGMSFVIGKLHVFAVFIALFLTVSTGKFFYILRHSGKADLASDASRISTVLRDSGLTSFARMTGFILLSILGFAISVFMMLELSKPIWEVVPLMAFFQYPWRFLLLASFFSSLLSGAVIWFLQYFFKEIATLPFDKLRVARNDKLARAVGYLSFGALVFLLVNFNSKLFQPQTILSKTSLDYTNETALKWTASKISDEYMPKDFLRPQSENEVVKDRLLIDKDLVTLENFTDNAEVISADISVSKETSIHVNLAHFPTWRFFIDGERAYYKRTSKGYDIQMPIGRHVLDIKFEQTVAQKTANTISLTGIAIVVVGIIIRSKKKLSV